ncbi:hypothetical protein DMS67_19035 [Klebsiella variicola]|nr:hypothetical protein CU076_20480 [Escherichia coli]EFJ67777.1 hypothetical protein HMPREF9547_00987 [Escherichia coli MS 175-1]EFN8674733.1 hypothetical protein [Escherichia coli O8]PXH45130.1 hypothetical protein DMS67_19035 [Klebsiella variicola]EAC1411561.1 hypothetical protein [Escherichia coli]
MANDGTALAFAPGKTQRVMVLISASLFQRVPPYCYFSADLFWNIILFCSLNLLEIYPPLAE